MQSFFLWSYPFYKLTFFILMQPCYFLVFNHQCPSSIVFTSFGSGTSFEWFGGGCGIAVTWFITWPLVLSHSGARPRRGQRFKHIERSELWNSTHRHTPSSSHSPVHSGSVTYQHVFISLLPLHVWVCVHMCSVNFTHLKLPLPIPTAHVCVCIHVYSIHFHVSP